MRMPKPVPGEYVLREADGMTLELTEVEARYEISKWRSRGVVTGSLEAGRVSFANDFGPQGVITRNTGQHHDRLPYVHHSRTVEEIAVLMAKEIRYKRNGWNADLADAAVHTSKTPTKRDQARHEAWMHGALIALSVALYGDAVHVPEATAFVDDAPWKDDDARG